MCWYRLPRQISRKEAKVILSLMNNIIDAYGFVTLSDFNDLREFNCIYTDIKVRWYSLRGSRVSLIRHNGAYNILLPEPVDLE